MAGKEPNVELALIKLDGAVDCVAEIPDGVRHNCELTAEFYSADGFEPPWVGYVTLVDGVVVGNGGFVGPPEEGVVEIAYYTLPDLEGRGYATATARALIDLARRSARNIRIVAHTLPETGASTAILEKLGFYRTGTAQDADEGEVWEWILPAAR